MQKLKLKLLILATRALAIVILPLMDLQFYLLGKVNNEIAEQEEPSSSLVSIIKEMDDKEKKNE